MLRPRAMVSCALVAICAGAVIATPACKKKPTCKPDEHQFEAIRLVIQPGPDMNLDDEGLPRATVLQVFQLQEGRTLDTINFDAVHENAEEFFGDELLAKKEITIHPDRPDYIEVEPVPDATHVVVVGLFREPGNDWYAEWEVPQFHGHSWCGAKKKGQDWPDPCLYLTVEGSDMQGGHKPPVGFDADKHADVVCPGPPLKVAPKPEEKKKKKKKKKKVDGKESLEKGQDGADKAGEAQDGADKAGGAADKAPGGE